MVALSCRFVYYKCWRATLEVATNHRVENWGGHPTPTFPCWQRLYAKSSPKNTSLCTLSRLACEWTVYPTCKENSNGKYYFNNPFVLLKRESKRQEMKKPMANNHIYLLHAFGFFLEICRDGISLREKGGHFSFLFFSWLGSARLVLMPLLFTLLLYYFDPFCVAHLAMSNTKTCCFSLMYWRA